MVDKEYLTKRFNYFAKKMELVPEWNLKLEFVEEEWKNNGNVKVDMDGKTAIVYINIKNPTLENIEEVIIHELCHIKLWKLDQYSESLLDKLFPDKNTDAYNFGYDMLMCAVEQTTQEFAKTYVKMFANNKKLSFGRCENRMDYRGKNKE